MEAARQRLEPHVALHPDHPVSLLTVAATEHTITTAPTSIVAVTFSDRIAHPRKIAMTGFTYAYVATFETGAFCSSHTYAVYATSEPMKIRYANASSESVEKFSGCTSGASPSTSPATSRVRPPPNIWTAVDSSAFGGSGSRRDENEPSAHENAANTTRTKPIGLPRCVAPPGSSSKATPPKPTATLARVSRGTGSPVARRMTTTQSGTLEITSAARLDGMYCSATLTTPLPPAARSEPTIQQAMIWGRDRVLAEGAPRARATAYSSRPAVVKRAAPMRRGGIVSTATRIARYVEPQTTYTIPRQSQTSDAAGAAVAVVVRGSGGADRLVVITVRK